VAGCDLSGFAAVLARRSYTLERALTDPRLFSGIGNAYSDEILHADRLSPVALTQKLDDDGMAVHGRYGQPCPECDAPVQRIRYAANETDYCPRCQTGGTVLADRVLSRLLKRDWPRTLEGLEELKRRN
jgi:formamidopyrimidine-DNA glycosylase